MKVTVTGASGHLGGNLVRALLAEGHEVRALYASDTRPLDGLAVEAMRADVLEPASLERAFAGAEVVFHLAGRITIVGDRDGSVRRINVDGTANVCAACRSAGVRRLVHFSSIHAYQHDPWDRPLDETRPLADEGGGPCLTYDRTKAGGERAVREALKSGLDAVIVNPTAVLGPLDYKPSRMGAVLLKIARRELPGLVSAGFDWVDVRDVAAGAIAAAKQGRRGEKYLLGGHYRPFAELARLAAREAGVKPPSFVSPLWLAKIGTPFAATWSRLKGEMPLFTWESITTLSTAHPDIRHDKAARELGYRPRPLEETVADSVRWFRDQGRLSKAAA